jgi:hypothetical protein
MDISVILTPRYENLNNRMIFYKLQHIIDLE